VSTTFKRWGQNELVPRYVFADSIIAHQRILEIGAVAATEGMSAYCLLLKNARTVVACDSSLEATQRAQAKLGAPNLMFRPMIFEGLAPASFDLIAITDLAPFIRAPTFFDQLLRLLTPHGYVLGALRNMAGLALSQLMEAEGEDPPPSYGELRDLLEPRFSSIQVATQAPVLGYQLAFEAGEGLQLDTSLANTGGGEAAYYVVIAGAVPRTGITPLWVQLPPEPLAFSKDKLGEAALRARNWQIRFEEQKGLLEKARVRVEFLEQETHSQTRQLSETQEALARLQTSQAPVFDASANLELAERVSKLSADLLFAEGRANEAEARVSAMSMEVQRHVQALREATTDVLAAKESIRIEREKKEAAEAKLKEAQERIAQPPEQVAPPPHGIEELEKAKLEIDSQKATLEALRRELEAFREKHLRAMDIQSKSASEEADKAALLAKLQEQERAVHMLQSDLCSMREERDALIFQFRMRTPGEEAPGEALTEVASQAAREQAALEEELHKQSHRILELENSLSQKEDEVEAMREDLALRSHSVERSKNRIRELESLLAAAQTQSNKDSVLLGSEYDKLKQENASLHSMLDALRTKTQAPKNDEAGAEAHTAGAMLAALRKRYAEQEQVLAQTRESLEHTESELAAVHKQVKALSQEKAEAAKQRAKVEVLEDAEYIEGIDEFDEVK